MTQGPEAFIPYGRQSIDEEDIAAVTAVLRSDFLTQGPAVPAFEAAVANAVDAPFAVAMNSATSALHTACLALGLGPGKRLWTSPISFVASANVGLMCGAAVDFVDVDPDTATMSPVALAGKLDQAERAGTLPDIVMPVHFAGEPCAMQEIAALGARYGFRIIEDAAHAIGAQADGTPVGACAWSDITVFSFHPVKIITTGEGGVATTRHADLAASMALLRSHGVTREPGQMQRQPDGPWAYDQVALGFNYRMTDIQAALGTAQMRRLPGFLDRRHALARRYDDALAGLPVRPLHRNPAHRSALHLYVVRLAPEVRLSVYTALREHSIGTQVHYIPIHTQPYYRDLGFTEGMFPTAEQYYREALSLPLFASLSDADQDRVIAALAEALAEPTADPGPGAAAP